MATLTINGIPSGFSQNAVIDSGRLENKFLADTTMDTHPKPETADRVTHHGQLSRSIDPRRAPAGAGDDLLQGVLAVPDPDGLGADPGRHALSAAPVDGPQDGRQAGTCRNGAGDHWIHPDRHAVRRVDELAGRLGEGADRRRAVELAENPAAKRKRRQVAGGRTEGARRVDPGPRRFARIREEHATQDRRPGEDGARRCRRHRWRVVDVPGLVHHLRHHHGLRQEWGVRQPGDFQSHHRAGARR